MLMKSICSLFSKYVLSEIILNSTSKSKPIKKRKVNKTLSEMLQVVIITNLYFEMGSTIESIGPCC